MLIAALIAAIAVAAGLAAGGGPDTFEKVSKDWKKFLRKYVKDDEKRAQAEEILDGFRQDVIELHDGVANNVKQLAKVHHTYASTSEEYDALVDQLADDMKTTQLKMLDVVFEMRDTLGEDTYNEIIDQLAKDAAKRDKAKAKADKRRAKKEKTKAAK